MCAQGAQAMIREHYLLPRQISFNHTSTMGALQEKTQMVKEKGIKNRDRHIGRDQIVQGRECYTKDCEL
jgi:hypothetical protein